MSTNTTKKNNVTTNKVTREFKHWQKYAFKLYYKQKREINVQYYIL